MKRFVTFFITVLSCTMASLQAMEALSLQQLGLQTQLVQWEQQLHNAQNATERATILTKIEDFFEPRPALEELSQQHIPQKIAEPINNGNAWVREIAHQRYELELNIGRTKRVFRVHAPTSQPVSWDSTQSLSLSPDNRYLAIAMISTAAPLPQYGIDILEITQAGLVPFGHISLASPYDSCCNKVTWTEQGIIIGNNQRLAICKCPLLGASKHAVQTPQWTELVGWKKFARNAWSVLETPCTVAAIGVMTLAIAASLTMITQGVERLHTYPMPIGN